VEANSSLGLSTFCSPFSLDHPLALLLLQVWPFEGHSFHPLPIEVDCILTSMGILRTRFIFVFISLTLLRASKLIQLELTDGS
jgi:hypothetical protein